MKTNKIQQILVVALSISLLMGSVQLPPLWGNENQKESVTNTEKTVNTLDELIEETVSLNVEDELNSNDKFSTKRLIVLSDSPEFNTYNAASNISYDNLYILSYDTKDACKFAFERLSKDSNIISVEIDSIMETETISTVSNEIEAISEDTELKQYLDSLTQSKEVKVAILDTGINKSKFENIIDLGINLSSSGKENSIEDDNGHGTYMADIISESTSDNVKLMPIKIANSEGESTILNAYLGIKYAMENDADIINISMSAYSTEKSLILEDIINEATEKGIAVVVAAGNRGQDTKNFVPANIESAITIGATDVNGIIQSFSNFGTVDYVTIGEEGTSPATAYISGIIARIKCADSTLNSSEIQEILNQYVIDLGDVGYDKYYGKGFVSKSSVKNNDSLKGTSILDYQDTWNTLSDDEVSEIVAGCEPWKTWVFLSRLSDEELSEILSRNTHITQGTIFASDYKYDKESNSYKLIEEDSYEYNYYDYLIKKFGPLGDEENILKINAKFLKSSGYCNLILTGMSGTMTRTISISGVSTSINYVKTSDTVTVTDTSTNSLYGYTYVPSTSLQAGGNGHFYILSHNISYKAPVACCIVTYTRNIADIHKTDIYKTPRMDFGSTFDSTKRPLNYTYGNTLYTNIMYNMGIGSTADEWDALHATATITFYQQHNFNAQGNLRTAATCTEPATYWYKCSDCGIQGSTYFTSGNPTGHKISSAYSYATNNDIANGVRYKKCVNINNGTPCDYTCEYAYLVSLLKETGIESVSGEGYYEVGSTVTIEATASSNYRFLLWVGETFLGSSRYARVCSFTMPESALQLTASSLLIDYGSIIYDGNGGAMSTGENTVVVERTTVRPIIISPLGFVRTGYTFVNWNTEPDGTGKSYSTGYQYTSTNDLTLYAQWKANQYTVTYVDVIDNSSGQQLGKTTQQVSAGTTVKGSDIGIPAKDNDPYIGYYYYDCTMAVVEGDTTVYRIFKVRTVDIPIEINWEDNDNIYATRPSKVTLKLMNGINTVKTIQVEGNDAILTKENTWKTEISGVPMYDSNGNKINYTVVEEQPVCLDGSLMYNVSYLISGDKWIITNHIVVPKEPEESDATYGLTFEGNIAWKDEDDKYHFRPEEVVIELYQNGNLYDSQTINSDTTSYIFTGLPKIDTDISSDTYLDLYEYTIKEKTIDNYVISYNAYGIDTAKKDSYGNIIITTVLYCDITNTFTPSEETIRFGNNLLSITPNISNIDGFAATDADFRAIGADKEDNIFITLKQMSMTWEEIDGVNGIYQEIYWDEYSGLEFNMILNVGKTSTMSDIMYGKYEIVLTDNSSFDFRDIRELASDNATFSYENNKYYVTYSYEYEEASEDLEVNMALKSFKGYTSKMRISNYFKINN